VNEYGRPEGLLELDGATYVLRMHGAEPHETANWHYCHLRPPVG
jgi:hypothetical protein